MWRKIARGIGLALLLITGVSGLYNGVRDLSDLLPGLKGAAQNGAAPRMTPGVHT
jgi:hypothetical protein